MSQARTLNILVLLLFALGLILIFNASSADIIDSLSDFSDGEEDSLGVTHIAALRQVAFALVGIGCGYFLYRVDLPVLIPKSKTLILLLSAMLLLVFIPGIGVSANGARRWIRILGFSLQPSEFLKLVVPLYFARCFSETEEGRDYRLFFRKIALLALPWSLIVLEPNNGTAGVIVLLVFLLFFLARLPAKLWALPAIIVLLIGTGVAVSMPYVRHRIDVFMHPEKDLKGRGHQPYQAKIASGSGGLLGRGPGKSMQKLSYLPEAQNDYIAAIYAEEYGFIGIFVLIAIYGALTVVGISIAYHAPTQQGYLIAAGYTFLLSFQAFLNLGVVSGLLPSTGLNLPFFSQGGSSLIANFSAIGVLAAIGCGKRGMDSDSGLESFMQKRDKLC